MKNQRRTREKDPEFYPKLLALLVPMVIQNVMNALVSASDALMVGTLDQSSLSAVSLATQITFVLSLFYAAITIGTTVMAAQYWGKGDKTAVEKIMALAFRLAAVISVIFFLACFFAPQLLMRVFTSEEDLIRLGSSYLKIAGWSYLLSGISQVYLCIMKNTGRTTRSTIYGTSATVLNLILNAIFIYGLFGVPKMAVAGAAVATLLARIVEFGLCFIENMRTDTVKVRVEYLLKNSGLLGKDFARYTTPILANELAWGCGFTMFSVILGHMGSDAVAANSIANITKNILLCVAFGISGGSGILVGNELGDGNLEKAREYGDRLCHLALATGIISGLILLAVSPLIVRACTTMSPTAKGYLQGMLLICAYYLIGKTMNATVVGGIFCSGGDTRFGMICDTITLWVIVVPIGALAAFVFKAPVMVVYFLLNLDEMIKLPAVYKHYKKYQWVNNITRENMES